MRIPTLRDAVLITTIFAPCIAHAGTAIEPVIARVVDAGTNSDGSVFVVLDRPLMMCGNKIVNRLDVGNDHPAKNQILLIGMTALTTFGNTKTYVAACKDGAALFSPTSKSFFQLTAEKAVPLAKQQ